MMLNKLPDLIKKQYNNLMIFRAYSFPRLLKEAFLLPKDLLSNSGESSSVLNIALFVTTRCNARCAMCNITGIINDKSKTDIPLDKIEGLLDDVAHYRPSIILFGGEPFVRKDIVDIVRSVKKRRLGVGMFTNGISLDETLINNLIEAKLDYIAFSLQGTKKVHDSILSVPGAYDKMIRNISAFTAIKPKATKVITHTTISEYNIADLSNIARTALDLGVDLVRFGHPTFYSSGEEKRSSEVLKSTFKDSDEIKAASYIYDVSGKEDLYLEKIKELQAEFGSKISFTPDLGHEELKAWYSPNFRSKRSCLFAWRGLFIHPNGDVYPCESISYNMGNVFEEGFSKVWNGSKYKEFRRILKKGLTPACARCCKL